MFAEAASRRRSGRFEFLSWHLGRIDQRLRRVRHDGRIRDSEIEHGEIPARIIRAGKIGQVFPERDRSLRLDRPTKLEIFLTNHLEN